MSAQIVLGETKNCRSIIKKSIIKISLHQKHLILLIINQSPFHIENIPLLLENKA